MEKKVDQRVKMTKLLLEEALVKQMTTQHISKISVRALCDDAGINRSTFYAHYADQYALLHSLEEKVLSNLDHHLKTQTVSPHQPISAQTLNRILDYIKGNADLFKALLSDNSEYSFQHAIIELAQLISIQVKLSTNPRLLEYMHAFSIMGCISVLQKWLQDGLIESTQTMTDLIMQMLYHGALGID